MKSTGVSSPSNELVINLDPPTDGESDVSDEGPIIQPSPFRQSLRHTSSASSGYGTANDNTLPKARVKLPSRYLVRLTQSASKANDLDVNSNTAIDYPDPLPNDRENRERDLEQALKWIRQEIMLMREQDKTLTSQFIGLRSRILQLRCWLEIYGSASDMSSLDGSSMSLEDSRGMSIGSTGNSLLSPDNELEFRNRTSSMRIVRRPPSICPRISEKRRSKEYT